jgi:hypothetical protein
MRDFWMIDLAPYLREHLAPEEIWGDSPAGMVRLPATRPMLNLLYQQRFHARIVGRHNRRLRDELHALKRHVDSVVARMPE